MKIPGGFESLRRCLQLRDYRLYVIGSISHGLGAWTLRVGMGWVSWPLAESQPRLGRL